MSEHLQSAAEAMGVPEEMVRRSAQARAQADGVSIDEVLAAWAGGGPVAAARAAPPAAEPPPPVEEAAPPAPVPATEESPRVEPASVPAAPAPKPVPATVPARPVPDSVGIEEARNWESVTTVPTAGLRERTGTGVPAWLTAAFLVIPLIGLLYLLQFSDGPACGDGGLLAVDRLTGEVVNCDGSPFEGRGAPGSGPADFLARGQVLYADAQVACNGCHGNNGEGGVGPAFTGGAILTTFPTCADHVKWVELGSAGWQAQVGAEYGAQNTLSVGGMPNFDSLGAEDLRAVVLFERVRFGGTDLAEALIDCGLAEPEEPAEGEEAPAEGEDVGDEVEAAG